MVEDLGEFQPIFPRGSTRRELERQLGSLSTPRAVTAGGFDWQDGIAKMVAESDTAKECPGRPFISNGFGLTANFATPPTPDPAQP